MARQLTAAECDSRHATEISECLVSVTALHNEFRPHRTVAPKTPIESGSQIAAFRDLAKTKRCGELIIQVLQSFRALNLA